MSQAEKTLLRYNYLMSVTTQVQGDFASTASSYANQVRLLKLNIQSLASVIGQGLIAAVLPGIQALNALMTKLMQAATVFRDFMYVLMGKKIKGSQSGVVNDLAGLEDTSYDLSGIEDAGDSAADGLDNATSAAKDLKKALSVLPFDELNQLTDNSDSGSSGTGSGSGGTGSGGTGANGLTSGLGDLLDDAYDVDEISPVNEWAAKIRKAFLAHDWEGLGKTVADGINKGLQKIYNLFKWDNAKKKIEPFIDAFTRTVNSLVDNLNWDLMGKTVGAGITTLAKSFDLLVTKINFENIGKKISQGLKGMLGESDWTSVGNAIGDGFMVAWRLFGGFVTDMAKTDSVTGLTGFQTLGKSVATSLNGIFAKIDFSTIASYLSTGINGAFKSLAQFTKTFEWDDFEKNLESGIATAIKEIKWKENAQALSDFLSHLCSAISDLVNSGTFHDLGVKIGNFIASLPWGELLKTAAGALWSGFTGLLEGLFNSEGFAGKIGAALATGFAIVKVGDITGLNTLASAVISLVGDKLKGDAQKKIIKGALEEVIGDSTTAIEVVGETAETASKGGLSSIIGKFSTLAGSGVGGVLAVTTVVTGLTAALIVGAGKFADWIEKIQGGNGVCGTFGSTTNALISKLEEQGVITEGTASKLTSYREEIEKADMSSDEMKEATQLLIDKMSEMGVPAESIRTALQAIDAQGNLTSDMIVALAGSVQGLDTTTLNASTSIASSTASAAQSYSGMKTAVQELYEQNKITADEVAILNDTISASQASTTPAETAYSNLKTQLEYLGVSADDIEKTFGTEIPSSMQAASTTTETNTKAIKDSFDKNIVGAQQTVKTASSSIESSITDATSSAASEVEADTKSIANSAATNMGVAQSNTSTYATSILNAISNAMTNSSSETSTNMDAIKYAVAGKMSETYMSVSRWMESIYGLQVGKSGKWTLAKSGVEKTLDSLNVSVGTKLNTVNSTVKSKADTMSGYFETAVRDIKGYFESLPEKVKSALGDMYSIGQKAGQSFASGMRSAYIQKPYLYVSNWNTHYYNGGKSWYYTPNFKVGWYAKGGLFDSASVIGVGEAGKEAVLPLENKRTMKLIADSIADSSGGGIGLSREEMSEAVAEGVATAMMNNSGNAQNVPQYVMASFSIGESEIVKAVAKAQSKYNSRMNPSPVY